MDPKGRATQAEIPSQVHATPSAAQADGGSPPSAPTVAFQGGVETEIKSTAASARPLPSIPGYEIEAELGRGGMGVVYKARQSKLNRLVALKMILAGANADPDELARFRTEAEAIARVQHPNIVQIHEVGDHLGLPYFSLEFCEGGSLARKLHGAPLPPPEAAALVEKLAQAMHCAHENGVIHRDLKPANVLLQGTGIRSPDTDRRTLKPHRHRPSGVADPQLLTPKITDFGLAKKLEVEQGQTQSGTIMGTPSYMAPEQAGGKVKEIGPAADIYSLGAILYELLTGRPPFRGPTPVDTVMQVLNEEPVSPRRLQPSTPRDLETVTLKCLQKDPAKRYTSAFELAADLGRFQADEPILARPISTVERLGKWVKRRPLVAALLAVLTLVTLAGIIGISWALGVALQERNEAVAQKKIAQDKKTEAEESRQEATDKLWDSYLAQAQALRWSGRAGRRFESLDALKKAALLRTSLDLRNEAIACLGLVDLRVAKERDLKSAGALHTALDPNLENYASCDDRGNVTIYRRADDSEVVRLPGPGSRVWITSFDRSGRFFAGKFHPAGADAANRVLVWDTVGPKKILDIPRSSGCFAFSPDGKWFALGYTDGSIRLFSLLEEKAPRLFPPGSPPSHLAFHPEGEQLAVSTFSGSFQIRDVGTGQLVRTIPTPSTIRSMAWHPHGKLLAGAGADGKIYLWKTDTWSQHGILEGHRNLVTLVLFNQKGDLLASTAWDGLLLLWDPWSQKQLLKIPGVGLGTSVHFSPNDAHLGGSADTTKVRLWEIANALELQTFYPEKKHINLEVGLSPAGDLLACPQPTGTQLFDVSKRKPIAYLPGSNIHSALFSPDGTSLITSGRGGIVRWPLARKNLEGGVTLSIGPPQSLSRRSHGFAAVSRNGKVLVAQAQGGQALVIELAKPDRSILLKGYPNLYKVAVSPEGEWVATGAGLEGVKIWDAKTGELKKDLPLAQDRHNVAFSHDGQWLVTSSSQNTGAECRFWKVGTWEPGHCIYQDVPLGLPAAIAFSPEGDLLATTPKKLNLLQLLDPKSGKEIANLEPLDQETISGLCFSANGAKLAVASDTLIHVWDLRLLRQQLADMKLDWGSPLPKTREEKEILEVRVDLESPSSKPAPRSKR